MLALDSEDSDEINISQIYGNPVFSPDIQTESDNNVDDIFFSIIMSESSDPNDGGLTTVTGAQNALSDGFLNVSSSSTGETKTIKPVVLQGDFFFLH